jgi:hypothetical protein
MKGGMKFLCGNGHPAAQMVEQALLLGRYELFQATVD